MSDNESPFYAWRSAVTSENGPSSPTTRLVLLALSTYMNEQKTTAFPSTRTLASNTGLSRRAVEKHIRKARKEGWLAVSQQGRSGKGWKRNEYEISTPQPAKVENDVPHEGGEPDSPRGQEGGEPHSHGGEPRAIKVGNDVPLNSPENTPTNNPGKERASPSGDTLPASSGDGSLPVEDERQYPADAWQRKFAEAAWQHLDSADILSEITRRSYERDPPGTIDAWADVFRLLHERDGYEVEEIRHVMSWLLRGAAEGSPENDWIAEGMIASVPPLRKKTRTGDRTKFDVMYAQWKSDQRKGNGKRKEDVSELGQRLWRATAGAVDS